MYVNALSEDESGRVREAYGGSYDRLVEAGVHHYHRSSGAWQGMAQIAGAAFLNDVCVSNGEVSVFAEGAHLDQPNGCTVLGANVLVTTFSGEVSDLYRLGPSGRKHVVGSLPPAAGLIDSVVRVDGSWLLSSWAGGGVYRMALGGGEATRVLDLGTPADMGYDGLRGNLLVILPLS